MGTAYTASSGLAERIAGSSVAEQSQRGYEGSAASVDAPSVLHATSVLDELGAFAAPSVTVSSAASASPADASLETVAHADVGDTELAELAGSGRRDLQRAAPQSRPGGRRQAWSIDLVYCR